MQSDTYTKELIRSKITSINSQIEKLTIIKKTYQDLLDELNHGTPKNFDYNERRN